MNKQLYVFLVFCILGHSLSYAQDEPQFNPTNSDEFISENPGFVKIEDFAVPRLILQLSYGDARVRKIQAGSKVKIYYQITSGNYVGSVSAENFPALLDAFEKLKARFKDDIKPAADLLVKKYIDKDGLELGYIVEGKKVTWFVKPYRISPRTLFIKDPFSLEDSLKEAAVRLNELR